MSLSETDKSSDNRATPALNTVDGLPSPMAHATSGIAYRTENNSSTAPRVVEKDDQIIVFDGTDNKALFGRDGNGDYVVKVAKDGFDVLTAADGDLIFNSAQNVFKIVGTVSSAFPDPGTASPPAGGGGAFVSALTSVAHGLSFTPAFLAFSGASPTFTQSPNLTNMGTFGAGVGGVGMYVANFSISVNATNVIFRSQLVAYGAVGTSIGVVPPSATVYLLQETAS